MSPVLRGGVRAEILGPYLVYQRLTYTQPQCSANMSRLRSSRRSERLMQLFVAACGLFALTRCSVETRHKLPIRALEGIAPQFDLQSPISHREESLDLNCANSPSSRGCWGAGFDINTDVDGAWPDTGRIAEVSIDVSSSFFLGHNVLTSWSTP